MLDRGARLAAQAGLSILLGLSLLACSPTPAVTPASASEAPTAAPSASPVATAAVTPTPVPEPSPAGTAPTSVAPPCELSDLKASHGLVEGAAGSRLTRIDLISAITCSVDAFPALGLRDADGVPLVSGVAGGTGRIDLVGGVGYEAEARVANWCAAEPRFPVALELFIAGGELPVHGPSFPDQDDLPACNGGGGPILEANGWTAAP